MGPEQLVLEKTGAKVEDIFLTLSFANLSVISSCSESGRALKEWIKPSSVECTGVGIYFIFIFVLSCRTVL